MELTLREWLLIIGFIMFVIIVIDSVRRSSRKHQFKLNDNEPKKNNKREKITKRIKPVSYSVEKLETKNVNDNKQKQIGKKNKIFKHFEQVITLYVHAQEGHVFDGDLLFNKLLEHGLRFGEMNIFHRYATGSNILFSMANGVEPPNFDIEDFENITTPALSFFMVLPGPDNPLQALDVMLDVVYKIAQDLDGVVKDDNFSLLTNQTIEHYKQIINEFKYGQLLQERI